MRARREYVDRLLSSYIDGELTVRKQTELKRLLAKDPEVGRRLGELQKCRALISSLPQAEAPASMLEEIKTTLARRSLLGERGADVGRASGARELFVRKLLAAAAMVALMGVLGYVIYGILAPPQPAGPGGYAGGQGVDVGKLATKAVAGGFHGRLELTTRAFVEVDASINRVVESSGLLRCKSLERQPGRALYILSCTREGLAQLLAHLENNWARFDSATLYVETDVVGQPVVVRSVTPDQIARLTEQSTPEQAVRLAKDLALLNNAAEQLRRNNVLATDEGLTSLLTGIPEPVLTGGQRRDKTGPPAGADGTKIELAVVVLRSERGPLSPQP